MKLNSTMIRMSEGHKPPHLPVLDRLLSPDADVTVINDAGTAWQRDNGTWQETATPFEGLGLREYYSPGLDLPRILVITPFHPAYGVRPDTWAGINQVITSYKGPVDWIISHNDNPHEQGFENVTYQHNKARRIALDGGYDYLLSIEADMIIPPDTIDKLLACRSDIAYGVYVWRHKLNRWNTYSEVGIFGGWSVSMEAEQARSYWGTIQDVAGLGMGMTLIKRNVLETVPFRLYDGQPGDWLIEEVRAASARAGIDVDPYRPQHAMFCDDWLLALDAQHHGFTQRANFDLICGHIDKGRVLWPDINEKDFVRIEE